MTHDELKSLLALAALERLEADEQASLRAHLAGGCAECTAELRELRDAAATLATAADDAAISGSRVASRVEARLAAGTAAAITDRGSSRKVDSDRRESRLRRASRAGFAAAVILAFYGAAVTVHLFRVQGVYRDRLSYFEHRFSTLQVQAQKASEQADALSKVLSERIQLQPVFEAPDLQITRLGPLKSAPQARAIVAVSSAAHAAVIQASGLPAPPEDKTYELWWITRESGPVAAGLFRVEPGRKIVAPVDPPPVGQHVLVSAVTMEPAGGVRKPTGLMYLKGSPQRE